MRLKRSRVKTYSHRMALAKTDKEGCRTVRYAAACPFRAEMWAAGGKLQAELYGIRLPNIRNLRLEGTYREIGGGTACRFEVKDGPCITVGDGICLYVAPDEEPDYTVVAVRPYRFLTLEVEKRVGTTAGQLVT